MDLENLHYFINRDYNTGIYNIKLFDIDNGYYSCTVLAS